MTMLNDGPEPRLCRGNPGGDCDYPPRCCDRDLGPAGCPGTCDYCGFSLCPQADDVGQCDGIHDPGLCIARRAAAPVTVLDGR